MPLTINPELQSLIPQLTTEEYRQLEINILEDGCRDALIVWKEHETILDGHHRYDICERHGLAYTTIELSLPNMETAQAWMIDSQLGRRNLTPDQMHYYRGKQYELKKKVSRGGGDRKSAEAHDQKPHNEVIDNTAQELAVHHKVSKATIEREAVYARNIDTIADMVGPEARQTILARETKVTQKEVKRLADIAKADPQTAKEVMAAVKAAPTPQEAQAVLAAVLAAETPMDAPSSWPRRVSSHDSEWYTPPEVIALVRHVLGTIEVDPASCAAAQAVVNATTYYTVEDDGIRHYWKGTVFCNPPYKMPEVARFVGKLVEELDAGRTTEAILLVNAVTETDWFQFVAPRAAAICFPNGRIRFTHATHDGLSPCSGQALLYFGPQVPRFSAVFGELGLIMLVLNATTPGPQLELAEAPPAPPTSAPAKRGRAEAIKQMARKLRQFTCPEMAQALDDDLEKVRKALQAIVKATNPVIKKDGTVYTWVGHDPRMAEAS